MSVTALPAGQIVYMLVDSICIHDDTYMWYMSIPNELAANFSNNIFIFEYFHDQKKSRGHVT